MARARGTAPSRRPAAAPRRTARPPRPSPSNSPVSPAKYVRASPSHHVAERGRAVRSERQPPPVVRGGHRPYGHRRRPRTSSPGPHLGDPQPRAAASRRSPGTARRAPRAAPPAGCPARAGPARRGADGRRADGRPGPRRRRAASGGGSAPRRRRRWASRRTNSGSVSTRTPESSTVHGGMTPPGDLHRHRAPPVPTHVPRTRPTWRVTRRHGRTAPTSGALLSIVAPSGPESRRRPRTAGTRGRPANAERRDTAGDRCGPQMRSTDVWVGAGAGRDAGVGASPEAGTGPDPDPAVTPSRGAAPGPCPRTGPHSSARRRMTRWTASPRGRRGPEREVARRADAAMAALSGTLFRVLAVWLVSTLTMLVLAGLLPDFRLQSASGDSATRIAVTAALGAGAFGLLSALVWPLLVRALLLVPALVLGLLVFFLNGSLLLLALAPVPDGRGEAAPETAVVVAAVMSAVASATGARPRRARRRRLPPPAVRLADRRRRREGRRRPGPATPGTVFLQLDGVGHDVLREAVRGERAADADRRRAGCGAHATGSPPGAPTGPARPAPASSASCTAATTTCPPSAGTRRTPARSWSATGPPAPPNSSAAPSSAPATADCSPSTAPAAATSSAAAPTRSPWCCRWPPGAASENRSRAGLLRLLLRPGQRRPHRRLLRRRGRSARSVQSTARPAAPRARRACAAAGSTPSSGPSRPSSSGTWSSPPCIGDMLAGRTAVYADLVGYDEVAHHSGPARPRRRARCCARLDRSLALIAKVAEHAPRPYRHRAALRPRPEPRRDLPDALRAHAWATWSGAGCGLPVPRRAGRTPQRRRGARAAGACRAAPAGRGGRRGAAPAQTPAPERPSPDRAGLRATSAWSPSRTCRAG